MDPKARGCFIGLTLAHTPWGHMISGDGRRFFAMKDSLPIMKELGLFADKVILSGGGAMSHVWRFKFRQMFTVCLVHVVTQVRAFLIRCSITFIAVSDATARQRYLSVFLAR